MNKKSKKGPTDRPTDQPTDQPTDKAECRVACTRLKIRPWRHFEENSKLFNLLMDIK